MADLVTVARKKRLDKEAELEQLELENAALRKQVRDYGDLLERDTMLLAPNPLQQLRGKFMQELE